ncbi:Calx-beta domain-containing protein [Microcoleus sp. FACHB-672]|uniref:Calx-beta domain-containing protein n=1 Tax=Microcoleus sp. FACHB-672 TaxID=2692825 RepID=UPI0016875A7C|nr:Calx-beta domain-containing protein [Microcoleus sp. FACHB-672]MBD2043328.1 FG-GAP repeat protein [Microcoleus sp. FACHB-672]
MSKAFFNLSDLLSELNVDGSKGFVLKGNVGDKAGISVSNAGDINGDGIDDVIVGAYHADPNGNFDVGSSYVVFGSTNGFAATLNLSDLDGSNGFALYGAAVEDFSGYSVSNAGDINGDGIDDLIVGANRADPNGNFYAGSSYVVFGSRNGFAASLNLSDLDGSNGFALHGAAQSDHSGISVSNAGDINGDGIADLIVGANQADINGNYDVGSSYVVFGSRNGFAATLNLSDLDGSNGFAIYGSAAGDYSGESVSAAGDINGDGIDDLVVGAKRADYNGNFDVGSSYVVFGSSNGFAATLNLSDLDGSNGFALHGADNYDLLGESVSAAGDINGDSIDDLIVGATANSNRSGGNYVVFGSRNRFAPSLNLSDLDGSNGFALFSGIGEFNYPGESVSAAGDINGDGIDDVIVGTGGANPNGHYAAGSSYVVFGSRNGFAPLLNLSDLDGSNGFALHGVKAGDASGGSVSAAGDINGDSIDDLIVGATGAGDGTDNSAGGSYVIFGNQRPTLDLNGVDAGIDYTTNFTAGTAVAIANLATLTDNNPSLVGASVTLTNPLDGIAETLSANTAGTGITATYDSATGILTLAGNDTIANYQQVLRSITYNNTAALRNTTPRTIQCVVDDGQAHSNTNIVATTTLAVTPAADLALTQTVDKATPVSGELITYMLTVSNAGPNTLNSLSLTDIIPAGLLNPSYISSAGVYDSTTGVWTGLNLAAGENLTLNVVGRVDPNTGTLTNTASVAPPAGYVDGNAGNNTATTTLNVIPTLSISDVTLTEGNTDTVNATFTVNLSAASNQIVTANWTTANGTAIAGEDYTAASGNVTFARGETEKTLTVAVTDDFVVEASETFFVNLSNPSNTAIADIQGIATITDNDAAGITVSAISGNTSEAGDGATFSVVLNSQPTAGVTFTLTSFDARETTVSPTTLTFTSENWNLPQIVTIAGVDDAIADGNTVSTIVTEPATSADPKYNAFNPEDISITNLDNDSARVLITESGSSTNLTEGGSSDSYTVVLTTQPTTIVTLNLFADSQLNISTNSLTFTPENWQVPQSINLEAIDYLVEEGNHTGTITHTITSDDLNYSNLTLPDLVATITDKDRPAISILPTGSSPDVTEGGNLNSYSVVLTTPPKADVTINVVTDNQTTATPSLTFTPDNWNVPQTVNVAAVDDEQQIKGSHTSILRHNVSSSDVDYNGLTISDVTVTVTDNDFTSPAGTAGIRIIPPAGSVEVLEGFGEDVYKVVLESRPTAEVTLTITAGSQVKPNVQTLTFNPENWNIGQTVTVAAVEDAVVENFHNSILKYTANSLDKNYNLLSHNLTINISDNDNPGLVKNLLESAKEAGMEKDDNLTGSTRKDVLYGRAGNDLLKGNEDDDIIYGGSGSDGIAGTDGNDRLFGGDGVDMIEGGAGDDFVYADLGSDRVRGGSGNDWLSGEGGNDFLSGDAGVNTLTGGLGNDAFAISLEGGEPTIERADIITDFINDQDIIFLTGPLTFQRLHIFQGSGDYAFDTLVKDIVTNEYLAILQGVSVGSLSAGNFV